MKSDCELSVKSLITAAAVRSRLRSRSLYQLLKHTSDNDLRARKTECISWYQRVMVKSDCVLSVISADYCCRYKKQATQSFTISTSYHMSDDDLRERKS